VLLTKWKGQKPGRSPDPPGKPEAAILFSSGQLLEDVDIQNLNGSTIQPSQVESTGETILTPSTQMGWAANSRRPRVR
jgi:hypothetical protein